jgi:hypothetical protein
MRKTNDHEELMARLADGTLPEHEAAVLRRTVARSPGLAAVLAEQERAVALVQAVDVAAPDDLRARVDALAAAARPRRARRSGWRRPSYRPLAAMLTAAVLALALVLSLGGTSPAPRGPTVLAAAQIALASATFPAPGQSGGDPAALRMSVGGVAFPYWDDRGWRSDGARTDRLGGHKLLTVFYRSRWGARVGYAIASGGPLALSGVTTATLRRGDVRYTLVLGVAGMHIVTWLADGHSCVLASRTASDGVLLKLAGWSAPATRT